MVLWHTEKNAETGRRGDTGLIDESLIENKISASVIDAAIEVHRVLGGPGLQIRVGFEFRSTAVTRRDL